MSSGDLELDSKTLTFTFCNSLLCVQVELLERVPTLILGIREPTVLLFELDKCLATG
jgi:hypothetical protein